VSASKSAPRNVEKSVGVLLFSVSFVCLEFVLLMICVYQLLYLFIEFAVSFISYKRKKT